MPPLVTVYCLTYNHYKYIRETLEGFINQKTDFPYEVIVHDDASTDGTADIIQEYSDKYPDIIIPIIQTENQYSKGTSIFSTYIFPQIRGKYIAVCEGDDYWCDPEKLQYQVEWMERNPDYALCAHNSKYYDCLREEVELFNNIPQDRDFSFEEILFGGKGGRTVFHTSSILYRREYAIIPDTFRVKGIGDYPKYLYMATCGKIHCLSRVMSVYRANVPNSWTNRMTTGSDTMKKYETHALNIKEMLERVDVATDGKYTECIQRRLRELDYDILFRKGDIEVIKNKYRDIYSKMIFRDRLILFARSKFPYVLSIYHKVFK